MWKTICPFRFLFGSYLIEISNLYTEYIVKITDICRGNHPGDTDEFGY